MADEKSTVLGIRLDTEERKRFDEFVGEEGKNNKDFLNTLLNSMNEEKLIILSKDNTSLKQQHNQLQESSQDKLTIIKEYQSKNDTLTGILEEYKQYKVEVEQYKKSLSEIQSKNIELKDSIKDKDFTVNNLSKDIVNLKEDHEKSINGLTKSQEQLKDKHIEDIQQLNDKASITMDKALLKLQKEQQEQLKQNQVNHNAEIQEYQSKYKSLLEELEKKKPTPRAKKDNAASTKLKTCLLYTSDAA